MKKIAFVLAPLFAVTIAKSTFAAPKPVKVPICHFQEDEGIWVLKTLPEKAAQNHLNRHDDAAPGGVTAESATQLDENCGVVAVAEE